MEMSVNDTVKRGASPQLLTQFPPFSDLDPAALQALARRSMVETIPAGRLLFKPGLCEHQCLFLLSGEVALMSDQRTADHVSAGTRAAERELGAERPRQLWGWSRTRVEVLWVDAPSEADVASRAPAPQADPQPDPSPTPEAHPPLEPTAQVTSLQQALQTAEADLARAETEIAHLHAQMAALEQALEQERKRAHLPERMPQVSTAAPAPAETANARHDASGLVACTPGEADTEVPSLCLGAGTRGAPGADEIDDLLKAWETNASRSDARRF